MRTILIASLVLLATAVPAQARKRAFCDMRPGATVVADGSRRIYETVIPVKGDPDGDVTTVYSCAIGSRKKPRRVQRYKNSIDGAIRPVSARLAGRWLLLDTSEESAASAGHSLRLFDLAAGREQASLYVDGGEAFTYALAGSGAFATFVPGGLNAFDAGGTRTLAGEAATELAAGGQRVYWTEGGTVGNAVLGAAPKGHFSL